jgi:hypothetical protein
MRRGRAASELDLASPLRWRLGWRCGFGAGRFTAFKRARPGVPVAEPTIFKIANLRLFAVEEPDARPSRDRGVQAGLKTPSPAERIFA